MCLFVCVCNARWKTRDVWLGFNIKEIFVTHLIQWAYKSNEWKPEWKIILNVRSCKIISIAISIKMKIIISVWKTESNTKKPINLNVIDNCKISTEMAHTHTRFEALSTKWNHLYNLHKIHCMCLFHCQMVMDRVSCENVYPQNTIYPWTMHRWFSTVNWKLCTAILLCVRCTQQWIIKMYLSELNYLHKLIACDASCAHAFQFCLSSKF